MELKRVLLRLHAVEYESIQNVRKIFMNQIRDILRKIDMGIDFNEVEEKKEDKTFDTKYADAKLLPLANKLIEEKRVTEEEGKYIYEFFNSTVPSIKQLERSFKKNLGKLVKNEAIYTEFLDKVRGIDKVLSAKLIKEIGYCDEVPDTVSKLWAYAGQSVVNGVAQKRIKGQSISYNPRLKSLVWMVSKGMLIHNQGYYRQVYDTEKEKQLNREYEEGILHEKYPQKKSNDKYIYPETATKLILGHAHNRALRKMRKIFLDHYWHCARELMGLPAKKNYVEGVLLHDNIVTWKKALEMEGTLPPKLKEKKATENKKTKS